MGSLWQDLRFAARSLPRDPGFAAFTLFTLALVLGANTAIFSGIEGVPLRPLPFPRPDELVVVAENGPSPALLYMSCSPPPSTAAPIRSSASRRPPCSTRKRERSGCRSAWTTPRSAARLTTWASWGASGPG